MKRICVPGHGYHGYGACYFGDPWWGCYVIGDAQDSNQFELVGGIVFRFQRASGNRRRA